MNESTQPPAELLRKAASKLKDTAKGTAGTPWTCSPVYSPDATSTSGVYSRAHPTGTVESEVVASGRVRSGYGGIRNPRNAEWIALMSPALAEPIAQWLESVAAFWEADEAHTSTTALRQQAHAVVVAHAILSKAVASDG